MIGLKDLEKDKIAYDFIIRGIWKKKTNDQTQQSRNRVLGSENNQVVARGEGGGGREEAGEEIKSYKLPVIK